MRDTDLLLLRPLVNIAALLVPMLQAELSAATEQIEVTHEPTTMNRVGTRFWTNPPKSRRARLSKLSPKGQKAVPFSGR
jgi:hypothetical protein